MKVQWPEITFLMSHFILTLLLFLTESCYIFTHLLHKIFTNKNILQTKNNEKTHFSSLVLKLQYRTAKRSLYEREDCNGAVTFIFSSSLPPNQQVFGCRSKTAVFLYDVDNLYDM